MQGMEMVELDQVSKGEYITDELQGDTTDPGEQDWWHVITEPVRGEVAVTRYDGSPAIVKRPAVWRLVEDGQPLSE